MQFVSEAIHFGCCNRNHARHGRKMKMNLFATIRSGEWQVTCSPKAVTGSGSYDWPESARVQKCTRLIVRSPVEGGASHIVVVVDPSKTGTVFHWRNLRFRSLGEMFRRLHHAASIPEHGNRSARNTCHKHQLRLDRLNGSIDVDSAF